MEISGIYSAFGISFLGQQPSRAVTQKEYSLQQKTNDPWTASYFYPFVKSPDLKSEWSAGFKKTDTTTLEALSVSLTKGEAYLWCACGMSKISRFAMGRIMEPSLNHKNLL